MHSRSRVTWCIVLAPIASSINIALGPPKASRRRNATQPDCTFSRFVRVPSSVCLIHQFHDGLILCKSISRNTRTSFRWLDVSMHLAFNPFGQTELRGCCCCWSCTTLINPSDITMARPITVDYWPPTIIDPPLLLLLSLIVKARSRVNRGRILAVCNEGVRPIGPNRPLHNVH